MHAPVFKSRADDMLYGKFCDRHIGPRDSDVAMMLQALGAAESRRSGRGNRSE